MMSQFFILFIALCIFCACRTLAIPTPRLDDFNTDQPTNDSSDLAEEITFIEKTILSAAAIETIQSIAEGGISYESDDIDNMIDEDDFLELRGSIDKEHHLIAVTTNKLFTELSTMEDVDEILGNSLFSKVFGNNFTDLDVSHNSTTTYNSTTHFRRLVKNFTIEVLDDVERTILANASLAGLYKNKKFTLQNQPLPLDNTGEFVSCRITFWFCEKAVRQLFRESLTLNETSPYLDFNKAIVTLAKTPGKGDQVQQIFDEAIQLTVEKSDFLRSNNTNSSEAFLHSTLQDKLKMFPELKLKAKVADSS